MALSGVVGASSRLDERVEAGRVPSPGRRRVGLLVREHGVFGVFLAIGIGLRAAVLVAYPATFWFGDSSSYLADALRLRPGRWHPSGYPITLWLLEPFHSFTVVAAAQHLMGLATAVMLYALVRRRLRGWQATLVTLPVLLDAYQIDLEHLLMSDALFLFLTMLSITIVLWRDELSWRAAACAGLTLAAAVLVRTVGLALLPVLVGYLAVRQTPIRRVPLRAAVRRLSGRRAPFVAVAALVTAAALPLTGYVLWFHSVYGQYGFSTYDGLFLYARTAAFADCAKIDPPADERELCPPKLPANYHVPPADAVLFGRYSRLPLIPGGRGGAKADSLAGDFAIRAMRAQPGAYLSVVGTDTLKAFSWRRAPYPTLGTTKEYHFSSKPRHLWHAISIEAYAYGGNSARSRVTQPFAGWMRAYQRHFYVRGTMLGVIMLAALVAMIPSWRRWGGRAALPWLAALTLLVVPAATADFDYRYVLPAVPLAALALALAAADIQQRLDLRVQSGVSPIAPDMTPRSD